MWAISVAVVFCFGEKPYTELSMGLMQNQADFNVSDVESGFIVLNSKKDVMSENFNFQLSTSLLDSLSFRCVVGWINVVLTYQRGKDGKSCSVCINEECHDFALGEPTSTTVFQQADVTLSTNSSRKYSFSSVEEFSSKLDFDIFCDIAIVELELLKTIAWPVDVQDCEEGSCSLAATLDHADWTSCVSAQRVSLLHFNNTPLVILFAIGLVVFQLLTAYSAYSSVKSVKRHAVFNTAALALLVVKVTACIVTFCCCYTEVNADMNIFIYTWLSAEVVFALIFVVYTSKGEEEDEEHNDNKKEKGGKNIGIHVYCTIICLVKYIIDLIFSIATVLQFFQSVKLLDEI
jgi:hypothetical protein